ncbi:olfactory receptor 52E2-like [Rhinophrynus dorsalis]
MENVSNISTSFVLLGLVEMERLKYLYGPLCFVTYSFIMALSCLIVFVILVEESLHEPMYILICNLVLNGIFGSTSLFPKLITDLMTSSVQISRNGCLVQAFCVTTFAYFEISIFTVMAYDRYLGVCQPLQYVILMTNEKALKLVFGSFVFSFLAVLIAVLLSAKLPTCGSLIKNIFCDNMSFVILSCVDYSGSNFYVSTVTVSFLAFTISLIAWSYMKIFGICLKNSKEDRQKAFHTIVTHLLNYSVFLVGVLFIFIRFRLGNTNLPLIIHILLSATCLVFPPLLNPVIYGIRTKELKMKAMHHLYKLNPWTHF